MSIPLSFLRSAYAIPPTISLGEYLSELIVDSGKINNLLDCLCSTSEPAIYSQDISRPPLCHDELRTYISKFCLPHSSRPLGPNDRVMLVLPTGPENALALLAIASYHTCAPVNASCTASELKDDTKRLNARAVVTTRDAEDRLELQALRRELDCEIIYIEARASGPAGLFDMKLMGNLTAVPGSPSRLHGLNDRSLVLHTSGTSGKKKVVRYALHSIIVGTWSVVHSWGLRHTDINLNMMPLFHVGGIVRNLLAPALSGGSAIMCSGFDPIAFWHLAVSLKATWYYAAPTIHHAILASRPSGTTLERDIHVRLICNAAGGLLPSLAMELKHTFGGGVILPSYGMTECMPIASPPTNYQLDRPGCSGIACGPYLSIRNPQDLEKDLPHGNIGAVCVRGIPTFEGYEVSPDVNVPLDTSAFSAEGWFDSGDVGYLDNDGYLYITGRSKEIINKGGEVISPLEVEEAIMTAAKDYVKNVLAFSIEHDVLQETVGAVLVPIPTRPRISLAQLHNLLRDHLHPSKWPFAVVYMDDLPKNSVGKPLRVNLSSRLGLGRLTDSVPPLERHFEAAAPHVTASLADPIACSRVSIYPHNVKSILSSVPGVNDIALRSEPNGSLTAFVYIDASSAVTSRGIQESLSHILPGYSIPDPLHILTHPLPRRPGGEIDFDLLDETMVLEHNSVMSQHELLVRDVIAELLLVEPGKITRDSDFFLLGGNSLLLGKLSHHVRRKSGVSLAVTSMYSNSTVRGIASSIEEMNKKKTTPEQVYSDEKYEESSDSFSETLDYYYNRNIDNSEPVSHRKQTNPLNLIVQALPIILFYPLKAALTWSILLFALSYIVRFIDGGSPEHIGVLLVAIFAARMASRIICPLAAIAFKWVVIGKYRTGTHRMWSAYYLRWWIVNQSLRSAGRGIFSMHPSLEILYYRLLGARIGNKVYIDKNAKLGEYDLLAFQDGCRIDASSIRGFCVERNGYFRLDNIEIGRGAIINTYTTVSPGAVIPDGQVYGPHASSKDKPSPSSYATYNRTSILNPHWSLQLFIAWPIIIAVFILSYIPWLGTIWLMLDETVVIKDDLNALEAVIYWFASPNRIVFHALSRVVRAVVTPLLRLLLGIIVKRTLGLNAPCSGAKVTQIALLRRYINSILLSQQAQKKAFSILGHHYEMVSVVFRAMGAKIGHRVYWPGSGIYCLDPELLEIGDDVVFGSRSEFFTTDATGTERIKISDGAMIADRVVLLPGTHIGRQTIMGSGALSKRGATYEDGSTWMGNEDGEAICLNRGSKESRAKLSTLTPFGRAYYMHEASYFVFPYLLILAINITIVATSTAYWSISAVTAAQMLRHLHIHARQLDLFRSRWYRFGVLYGLIAIFFIIVLNLQAIVSLIWVVSTKWILLGRRRSGSYDWDKSSYCQRWQLHLVLSRVMYKGYGNGGILAPLTGSAYMVWYLRALGAKIGKNCSIYAGGRVGLMTEPDLVELGDSVNLDDCSVVAHINSRGNFVLNQLKIGNGCALRTGSRLLSGASMEDNSMLSEHTLLTSGEVAEADSVYVGWPAKRLGRYKENVRISFASVSETAVLVCPLCRRFPKISTVTTCGHLFCEKCINSAVTRKGRCPVCTGPVSPGGLIKVYPSFLV